MTRLARPATCFLYVLYLLAALSLVSCAHVGGKHPHRHPLEGKVWDVQGKQFVDPAVVMQRAVAARFVLLGEIHDNAEHHRIQARILDAMLAGGRRPALVMEQYDVNQQLQLNKELQGAAPRDEKLHALSELMRKSWDWPLYQPLVSIALQQKLPLVAANLPRETLREVARNGIDVLGAGEEARLAFEPVWTPARQTQLLQEITAAHCGKMPDHVFDAIARAQRVRDAVMADMLLLSRSAGALAIIGRNHARRDLGVPLYLAHRAPAEAVVSIGLTEADQRRDPLSYVGGPAGEHHDYLWFTSRPHRKSNPCDAIPATSSMPKAG